MNCWSGKVIVVTGASSGIGEAICEKLMEYNIKVIGMARRVERVVDLAKKLQGKPGTLFPLKCDVSVKEEVGKTFKYIKENIGLVNVVICNAGISKISYLLGSDDYDAWQSIITTNLLGACECARQGVEQMIASGSDGHVMLINSIAGKRWAMGPTGLCTSMYAPSKHALNCAAQIMRNEIAMKGHRIKVTSIYPGVVNTEIFEKSGAKEAFGTCEPQRFDAMTPYPLESEDVANSIIYALGTPKHVQIHDITLFGTTYQ